jgi:hypothetical protein
MWNSDELICPYSYWLWLVDIDAHTYVCMYKHAETYIIFMCNFCPFGRTGTSGTVDGTVSLLRVSGVVVR